MSRGRLFEYAIMYHPKPTKDQNDRGETPKSELLIPPTTTLSTTPEQVSVIAARAIPPTHVDKLDDIEIVVRLF
jgi:hypothetical protein